MPCIWSRRITIVVFVIQEQQRHEFETERDEMVHQNAMEKEELLNRFDREREDLQEELANLQRERDNQLLMAENDKQQVTYLCVDVYS